jgi:hypothetical protein
LIPNYFEKQHFLLNIPDAGLGIKQVILPFFLIAAVARFQVNMAIIVSGRGSVNN